MTNKKETRRFKMHPRLLMDVIQRQAGTLLKAILEGVMNGIDAGAKTITIQLTEKSVRIEDDGTGITERSVLEKFWETFGQPAEAGENKTYGYFRMGRGQLFAFGRNVWRTGPFEMTADVQKLGLEYELQEHKRQHRGCSIDIVLYEAMRPSDLASIERELEVAIKYVSGVVSFNGRQLNVDSAKAEWDHVLDDAYIKLRPTGNLYVYNLGVLVCAHPGHVFGVGGVVTSRKQLKVNFARNEVMASCPVWRKVKPIVDQKAALRIQTMAMTDDSRQSLIHKFLNREIDRYEAAKLKLLEDVNGRYWSLYQLNYSRMQSRKLTSTKPGSLLGDKIHKSNLAFVLSDLTLSRFNVESVSDLLKKLRASIPDSMHGVEAVNFAELQTQFSERMDVIPEADYSLQERIVLEVLVSASWRLQRWFQDKYNRHIEGKYRKLVLGSSQCADGWTDGRGYIAITREYIAKTGVGVPAWPAYGCLVAHELCHDEPDHETHVHSQEFYEEYHDLTSSQLGEFVSRALLAFPTCQKRHSKRVSAKATRVLDVTAAVQQSARSVRS